MTEETPHLDIIVASTDVFNIDGLIEDKISKLSKELGFDYNLDFQSEGWFLGPSWRQNYGSITQNAIIVTHGGQCVGYRYFKAVKELSEIRPDLRFIVRMESDKTLDDFGNNIELFAFYQQLEEDLDRMRNAHDATYDSCFDDNKESDEEDKITGDKHNEPFRYDITKPIIITHQSLPRYLCKISFSDIFCHEPHFYSYLKSFVKHLRQQKQSLEKQEPADVTQKPI